MGQIALLAGIIALVLGGVMLVLSALGILDLRRVAPETELGVSGWHSERNVASPTTDRHISSSAPRYAGVPIRRRTLGLTRAPGPDRRRTCNPGRGAAPGGVADTGEGELK